MKVSQVFSIRVKYEDLANLTIAAEEQGITISSAGQLLKIAILSSAVPHKPVQNFEDALEILLSRQLIKAETISPKLHSQGLEQGLIMQKLDAQQYLRGGRVTPVRRGEPIERVVLPNGVTQEEFDSANQMLIERLAPKVVEVAPELSDLGNMPNVEQIASDD